MHILPIHPIHAHSSIESAIFPQNLPQVYGVRIWPDRTSINNDRYVSVQVKIWLATPDVHETRTKSAGMHTEYRAESHETCWHIALLQAAKATKNTHLQCLASWVRET